MEKNWLIRTKNNHILGPVSKAKVKELVENGSIKADDEICSGNGFWFYAREKDMVAKYLSGEERQPFNPVSEAETVKASGSKMDTPRKEELDEKNAEVDRFPKEDDLSYPGLEANNSEVATVADGENKKKK